VEKSSLFFSEGNCPLGLHIALHNLLSILIDTQKKGIVSMVWISQLVRQTWNN